MAQSRLEKIGTIFTRTTNLMKGGILKEKDLPLWYAVYQAFPPKYEPRFDRPGSQLPIPDIYYPEDLIRAKFQEEFSHIEDNNLTSKQPSKTQQFIAEYQKLEKEGVPESELYDKAREKFVRMLEDKKRHQKREEREVRGKPKEPEEIKSHISMTHIFSEKD